MVSFIINIVCVRQPRRLNRRATAVAMSLISVAVTLTVTQSHANPPPPVLHGPLEHLQQTLVQSPADARLIAGAEHDLENGDAARAFLALRQVFAHPFDAFTPIASGQDAISSYQAAVAVLQRASYAVRADWTADTEPLAAAALLRAGSDSSQIAAIARHFPYTSAGLQAHAATVMLAESRGQSRLATALLAEVQALYADTAVTFPTGDILEMLSHRIDRTSSRQQDVVQDVSPIPATPVSTSQALPWPLAAWEWQESVWNYPEGINLFGGLTQPEQRPALIRNSWRPTLTPDTVLLRSPFRIVALDRGNGQELWSLPTDTLGKPLTLQQTGINALSTAPASVDEVLQMDDLGTIQVSERFLFFVDRFRRFTELSFQRRSQPRFGPRFVNPMDLPDPADALGGTRLVAVTLGQEPRVAWTAGDAESFDYVFQTDGQAKPASSGPPSPAPDLQVPLESPTGADNDMGRIGRKQDPFAGHHFMGVPQVYDQMLFVLSRNTETVWLNCLAEATGRLLWQHPVTFLNDATDGPRGRLLVQADPVYGASLCGISGTTVVCALNSGVVVGVRLTDGQLQWATNIRGEEQRFSLDGPASITVPVMPVQRISFPPLLQSGRMIWAAPQSTHIHCLDIATGKIVWKVPRSARGIGRLEGSDDHYAAAFQNDQVVMVGDRHVRALSGSSGTQQWVTEIPPQTGRAICSQKTCVVPLQDGTLASIDLQTGIPNQVAQDVFARLSGAVVGALVADNRAVCAATPLSIRMFPAIEEVLAGLPDDQHSSRAQWTRMMASVLQGELVPAIDQWQQFQAHAPLNSADNSSGNSSGIPSADAVFSELLLQTLALRLDAPGSPDHSESALISEQQAITSLQRLPLTNEQQLRLAVLTDGRVGTTQPAEAHSSRLPLLNLLPDWQVRLDVAAWSRLTEETARQLISSGDGQRSGLSRVEQAILFPAQIGSSAQQLEFAGSLLQQNRFTATELFLLAAANDAQTEAERLPLQRALREMRQRSRSLKSPLAADTSSVKLSEPNHADLRPLKARRFDIEETLHLHRDNRIAELMNARYLPLETPHWYPDRLFVSSRDVFRVDMQTGAVSIPIRTPEVPEDEVLRNSTDQPGLYPMIELDHVGVLSLSEPKGPEQLWWKRLEREVADLSSLQAGPIGPDFMIVASEQALFCLHPLTGSVLWRRQLPSARQQTGIYERALQLAGDHRVIGLFGQNMQSCEVFRTQDGKRLSVLPLDIPPDTTPLASGRHILYQVDQVLKLIDLQDGTNRMADDDPVKILAGGDARLISENRAVLLTEDYQILVLDMHSGRVVLRCPVLQHVHEQKLTGLSAFDREGRLFVLLRDWGSPYSLRSSSAALGDQRLDSGTLFCLNADTGELLWHHRTLPATMPQVYGDPCPLLVKWSWHNPERGRELRLGGNAQLDYDDQDASLVITILDAETGETLAEQQQLSRYLPIRCTYDADTEILKIDTDGSEIFVRPIP